MTLGISPRSQRIARGWGIMIVGAVLTYLIFSPGLMSPDAYDQIQQVQTGHFADWHPPMMAWLWSLIYSFVPGPQGFFVLIILFYWGGFGLICAYCSQWTKKRFFAAMMLPYLPFLVNFVGVVGKDQFVFGCFLVALGLILLRPRRRVPKGAAGSAIVLLLLVGSLSRYNSVLAVIPLVVLWAWPKPTGVSPLSSLCRQLAISGAVILLIWVGASNMFNRYVVHAEAQQVQSSLFAWQLLNISHLIGQNLLPGNWSPLQTREIVDGQCYSPGSLNVLHFQCHDIKDELQNSGEWKRGLFMAFIRAAMDHPLQYFQTRISYMHTVAWPDQIFVYSGGPQNNTAFRLISNAYMWLQAAPAIHFLFTLLFWITVSLLMAALNLYFWLQGHDGFYEPFLITLSAGLYIWPLVIIGIDGDFRYAYWAIGATCISVLVWPQTVRLQGRPINTTSCPRPPGQRGTTLPHKPSTGVALSH